MKAKVSLTILMSFKTDALFHSNRLNWSIKKMVEKAVSCHQIRSEKWSLFRLVRRKDIGKWRERGGNALEGRVDKIK
jgi:hypothetical protein